MNNRAKKCVNSRIRKKHVHCAFLSLLYEFFVTYGEDTRPENQRGCCITYSRTDSGATVRLK